jgi:hypothetical protein
LGSYEGVIGQPDRRHLFVIPLPALDFISKDDSNVEQRALTKTLASPPENTMIESLLGL